MPTSGRVFKKVSAASRAQRFIHEREVVAWMDKHPVSIGAKLLLEWQICGGRGWKSINTHLDEFGCTRRSLVSWINRLERWGWIRVQRGRTDSDRSRYELTYIFESDRAALN